MTDGDAVTAEVPDTQAVADVLGVCPDQLRGYLAREPDPTPATILGWAGADPKHADTVAEWLGVHL